MYLQETWDMMLLRDWRILTRPDTEATRSLSRISYELEFLQYLLRAKVLKILPLYSQTSAGGCIQFAPEAFKYIKLHVVNRRFYREELQRQERKYLNAAHRELFDELESGQLGAQIRDYQELRRDQSVSVNDKEIENEVMPANAEEQVENSSSDEK
ncbi:hypothetical protein ACTXT7_011888 [Hymenolepis weldensis]